MTFELLKNCSQAEISEKRGRGEGGDVTMGGGKVVFAQVLDPSRLRRTCSAEPWDDTLGERADSGQVKVHLPMQKREKMVWRRSSVTVSPVISPRAVRAAVRSIVTKSSGRP